MRNINKTLIMFGAAITLVLTGSVTGAVAGSVDRIHVGGPAFRISINLGDDWTYAVHPPHYSRKVVHVHNWYGHRYSPWIVHKKYRYHHRDKYYHHHKDKWYRASKHDRYGHGHSPRAFHKKNKYYHGDKRHKTYKHDRSRPHRVRHHSPSRPYHR